MAILISLYATLKDTLMAKNVGILSLTSQLKGCVQQPHKWLFRPNFFSSSKWALFLHVAFHFIEKHTPLFKFAGLQFFFLVVSFPKKAFVFPNNRISEAHIYRQCWFKKISWKRKTKQQKKLQGNVFPLSPRSHAKIELIWTRKKKFSLKSHLCGCCMQPFNLWWAPLSYNTHSSASNDFYTKPSRLSVQAISFSRIGEKVWNEMPLAVRNLSKYSFKKGSSKVYLAS